MRSSTNKSSSNKSSSKGSKKQEQEYKKIMAKLDIATRVAGAGVAMAGAKKIYDGLKGDPKKYLSENEYKEFQEVSAKISNLSKAKLVTLGPNSFKKSCTTEDCTKYLNLLNKAVVNKAASTKSYSMWDPRYWFRM
jgi:hypothetical protein